MKKKILNFTSILIFSLLALLTFIPTFFQDNSLALIGSDNEKENGYTCTYGYHVGIYCTEGTIDCQPRDCPY